MDKPTITPLPTPPNRQQGAAEFATRADEFLSALPVFGGQVQAVVDYADFQLDAVEQSAGEAQDAVTDAQSYAQAAQISADNAEASYQAAMAVAAAVGDMAGLPSMVGKAGMPLIVNEDESGATWGPVRVGTNAQGNRTVSVSDPVDGADGDIWL